MCKSESQISNEIGTFLTTHDFIHWRNQSGRVRVKGGYMHLGLTGLADRVVMLNRCHLYIEVKTKEGKQRDSQEAFERACKSHGHHYIIARSVKDVRDKLTQLGEM